MIQFLEIWKILGATKFTIYITSVTKTVYSLLKSYENSGMVEIVPWPLLPKPSKQGTRTDPNLSIYRFGHILALNDCILRHVGSAKFVAPVDFDEFIVPKKNLDLVALLNSLAKADNFAGSFKFLNTRLYYPASYELPWSINLKTFNLQHLSNLRLSYLKGPSKVILRPERALITLNHASRTLLPGFQRGSVEREDGELYHLRRAPINPAKGENVQQFRRFQKILPKAVESFKKTTQAFWKKSKIWKSGKEVLKAVTRCLSNWKDSGCKVPHEMCGKKVFVNRTDWIIFDSDRKVATDGEYDTFSVL